MKKNKKRALILTEGGPAGIAWEIGLIMGLYDAGVDLTDPDLIVGTSAGSTVGAQITSGLPLEEIYQQQLQPISGTREKVVVPDFSALQRLIIDCIGAPDAQTVSARIGALALTTPTIPEDERLAMIADRLPVHQWSNRSHLVIVSVDAQTGEAALFDQQSGISLAQAVAASSAVPTLYPPVTINGRRYIDGAVRSSSNADIARGFERVLILRPSPGLQVPSGVPHLTFEGELTALQESGSQVLVIEPDAASKAVLSGNGHDVSRRALWAQTARAQGKAIAATVKAFWQVESSAHAS